MPPYWAIFFAPLQQDRLQGRKDRKRELEALENVAASKRLATLLDRRAAIEQLPEALKEKLNAELARLIEDM